jgi:hypothetical protein
MPKIITVGGNVVTATSSGTTYALSIGGNTNEAVPLSGYASNLASHGSRSFHSVDISANAISFQGSIGFHGTATCSSVVTTCASVTVIVMGVTVYSSSVSSATITKDGNVWFYASLSGSTWTVRYESYDGTWNYGSGTSTSWTEALYAGASGGQGDPGDRASATIFVAGDGTAVISN